MFIILIGLLPLLFVGWCLVMTIQIVSGFMKFHMKCASVKKKNPELYRQMKEMEFRMTNGGNHTYVIIHNSKK